MSDSESEVGVVEETNDEESRGDEVSSEEDGEIEDDFEAITGKDDIVTETTQTRFKFVAKDDGYYSLIQKCFPLCLSCHKDIGHYEDKWNRLMNGGMTAEKAFEKCGLYKACCKEKMRFKCGYKNLKIKRRFVNLGEDSKGPISVGITTKYTTIVPKVFKEA